MVLFPQRISHLFTEPNIKEEIKDGHIFESEKVKMGCSGLRSQGGGLSKAKGCGMIGSGPRERAALSR